MTSTTERDAQQGAPPDGGFAHSVVRYSGDDDFVRRVGGFVREGLDRDEAVLVAEPAPRLAQLRDALGSRAGAVEWLDMYEVGVNPGRIISVWADFVDRQVAAGRAFRGVGEPSWPGRRPAEVEECRLHELLLNAQFGAGPGWQLACPYDLDGLPPEVAAAALRTHPWEYDGGLRSLAHDEADLRRAFEAPLPPPPAEARTLTYDLDGIGAVRTALLEHGTACGAPGDRLDDLLLAGWEVAVNSVRHGGGQGRLRLWREPEAMVAQFEDSGVIADPLVGRLLPPPDSPGGRGVHLAHQLCDLVQLRSSPAGTTVRLVTWL